MSIPSLPFVRSHGLGNDYLVLLAEELPWPLTPARIQAICDRHTGIGSDGILLRVDAPGADFGLRIFNPDGSEAEKSGNGLRIFAKFLFDHGYTAAHDFSIHTAGGLVRASLLLDSGRVGAVRVDMGQATIDRRLTRLEVAGQVLAVTALSVGNPHCVTIVDDLARVDLARLGPAIERHSAFPRRTNVQFARVASRREVQALIWERGAGHTLASGSSACAVAVACRDRQLVDGDVVISMEGGALNVSVDEALCVRLTGPVEEICVGHLSAELSERLAHLA
jgi:diaminopimelate epimerase